jgi:hypothetical protein
VAGQVKILGREPALWVGTIASVLSLGTAVGFPGLSAGQVAAIVVGLNAVAALVAGFTLRPVAPAIYTNVLAAAAAIGTAYGNNVPSEAVGAANFVVLAVLSLLTRGQVSPAGAQSAVAPPAPPPVIEAASAAVSRRGL